MKTSASKKIDIYAATSPVTVQMASDAEVITFYNNKTLAAPFAIQESGTPTDNCTVTMIFTGNVTAGVNAFSIFGITLDSDIVALPFFAVCYYTNSAWTITYGRIKGVTIKTGGGLAEGAGGGLQIDSNVITNTMINSAAAIIYSKLVLTNSIVNADIAPGAALAYSKLNLTGAILNADLAGSIAYAKLVLTGGIVNADVNAAAALAHSKMAALTASKILQSDGSGVVSVVDTATYPSLTELAYLKGVTSALQTQINAKAATTYVDAADGVLTAAIAAVDTTTVTYTTISANTVLVAATLKQVIRIDATSGAVDVTLPDCSTVAAGFKTTWRVMGANVVRLLSHAGQNLNDLTGADVSSLTITGAGNLENTICDGTDTFYQA